MKTYIIKTAAAVPFAAIASYFNSLLLPLAVLIGVMIVDYLTGMAKAYVGAGRLRARTSFEYTMRAAFAWALLKG